MIPTKITIPQLFQLQCCHLVPILQRPYVWSQERQWEPLWEDIQRKAEEVQHGGGTPWGQPRLHFLGAVVVKSLPAIGLETVNNWGEAPIRERGLRLFELALQIWPQPHTGGQG